MSDTSSEEPVTREMLNKRMDVEIAKLYAESSKLHAETSKLLSEGQKIQAETSRINREAIAYPWLPFIAAIVGNAGVSGVIAGAVAALVVAFHR